MGKYRVTFDVRKPDGTGGTVMNETVEADMEFMAKEIAEGKLGSIAFSVESFHLAV